MGSPITRDFYEEGRYDNETQREVPLTKGFWILETEVTRAMWEPLMRDDGGVKGPNYPLYDVFYKDHSDYIKHLNQKLHTWMEIIN